MLPVGPWTGTEVGPGPQGLPVASFPCGFCTPRALSQLMASIKVPEGITKNRAPFESQRTEWPTKSELG